MYGQGRHSKRQYCCTSNAQGQTSQSPDSSQHNRLGNKQAEYLAPLCTDGA
jgi:hypothetical protein